MRITSALFLIVAAGTAWGQGGRAGRNAAAQPPAATPTAAPTPSRAPVSFYNFDATATSAPAIPEAPPVETHGKVTVNGAALAYTARAGHLSLRNATSGQVEAHLFYTAYFKDGVDAARPILFFFGGAPGVSAAWQEFGGLGPKRMQWKNDGPPYTWADNPHTLLGQSDLVFVNPVGTAYSRADQPSRSPGFWNTAADIASLAEFVRSFLTAGDRRNSPLFLAGEDAGTARVAGLAAYLVEHQVPVSGMVLFSMTPGADAIAGDAQYITLLPSLVMASWYHKKLTPDLTAMSAEQISGQARQFASREYLHALYKGDRMSADERAKVVADLSRMTGLSKAFIVNNNLRVTLDRFNGELLREQHHGLSASDARVSGFLPPTAAGGRGGGGRGGFGAPPPPPIDFNLSKLSGGLETAYESYLRRELTFNGEKNGIFYLSSGGVGEFTSTGSDDASLSAAFARNPNLRLFLAVNYFDLNAPFYATEFTLAHLNVSPEVRAHNITVSHFEAGGMTYIDNQALAKLHTDLAGFLAAPARR